MTDRHRAFSSLSATSRLSNDFRQTLRVTQPLMETLTEWYRTLPQSSASDESAVNASGYLHLGFHSAKALLFRAIMRPFHNYEYSQMTAEDLAEHEQARHRTRIGAKSCATAFSNYISELKSGDTNAFWPFCKSNMNSMRTTHVPGCLQANRHLTTGSVSAFALQPSLWQSLFLSSPTLLEAYETKEALMQTRRMLRLRARSFEPLRLALLRSDSLWWRGIRETLHLSGVVEQSLDGNNQSSAAN